MEIGTGPGGKASSSRTGTMGLTALVIAAVVIALVMAFGGTTTGGQTPRIGQTAPAFEVRPFDGGSVDSESLAGQVIVLHFFASWCDPCRAEAPTLRRLWDRYRSQGVQFVGVAYKDVESKARGYMEEFEMDFPSGLDTRNQAGRAYGLTGVPETYIIDQKGTLVRSYIGAVDPSDVEKTLDVLLARP